MLRSTTPTPRPAPAQAKPDLAAAGQVMGLLSALLGVVTIFSVLKRVL